MENHRTRMLKLLDRSLIGLLIFVVMLLLGMNAVHASQGRGTQIDQVTSRTR